MSNRAQPEGPPPEASRAPTASPTYFRRPVVSEIDAPPRTSLALRKAVKQVALAGEQALETPCLVRRERLHTNGTDWTVLCSIPYPKVESCGSCLNFWGGCKYGEHDSGAPLAEHLFLFLSI